MIKHEREASAKKLRNKILPFKFIGIKFFDKIQLFHETSSFNFSANRFNTEK